MQVNKRVTAKSKPMVHLVSRCSVRNPNVLASTASESPEKTKSESQIPLSSWNEQQPRTVRPVMGASSSDLWRKIFHGSNYFWSMMKKLAVSRMQRFMYSQILWYVLERWIRTQHQILYGNSCWVGSKNHHNTELWTQWTESRCSSSGIFSQDALHCSLSKKSKSSFKNGRTRTIPRRNYLHVDVHRDSYASSELFLGPMLARSSDLGKHSVFIFTSRKTEIARFARGPKSQGRRAEDVLAESYFVQKILGI